MYRLPLGSCISSLFLGTLAALADIPYPFAISIEFAVLEEGVGGVASLDAPSDVVLCSFSAIVCVCLETVAQGM